MSSERHAQKPSPPPALPRCQEVQEVGPRPSSHQPSPPLLGNNLRLRNSLGETLLVLNLSLGIV